MRSLSRESSPRWKRTRRPVGDSLAIWRICLSTMQLLTAQLGLQTPRLKKLAEIVSAQAMAQQEKLEIDHGILEE